MAEASANMDEPKSEQTSARTSAKYVQALRALESGQSLLAQKQLQEVLAEDPKWAGAWLDLLGIAIAAGDWAQADEYLIAFQEQFSPLEPAVEAVVQQFQRKLEEGRMRATVAQSSGSSQTLVSFGLGHETNANAGLHSSSITLTLPEGDAVLPLAASSRSIAALSSRMLLMHEQQLNVSEHAAQWLLQMQSRQYQGLSSRDSLELLAQASIEPYRGPIQITAGVQTIALDGRRVYQGPVLRGQYAQVFAGCQWLHALQTESRQYLQVAQLNSHWGAYRSSFRCVSGSLRQNYYVQWAREAATSDARPGGDSHHRLLGIHQEWVSPWNMQGHSINMRAEFLQTKDTKTYSPLLDNGRQRNLARADIHLNWTAPVLQIPHLKWSIGAANTHQNSNIPIFNFRNFSIESYIWRTW